MFVDHLIQYRISPWPKTAEKRGFCTGVTDRPTNGPTDRWTDRPTDGRTNPLIEMRGRIQKRQRSVAADRETALKIRNSPVKGCSVAVVVESKRFLFVATGSDGAEGKEIREVGFLFRAWSRL